MSLKNIDSILEISYQIATPRFEIAAPQLESQNIDSILEIRVICFSLFFRDPQEKYGALRPFVRPLLPNS